MPLNRPLAPAVVLLVLTTALSVSAQVSQGFTAVVNSYFGCDPTTAATNPCSQKFIYVHYFDPNIGTSMISGNITDTSQPPIFTSTLINKTDGTRLQVSSDINAYYSIKLRKNPAPAQSSNNCIQEGSTLLGTETILGIETYRYQRGDVEPGNAASNGNDGTVYWLAPSLNCFPLRAEHHVDSSQTTFQLASEVILGTPPAWVFAPPAGAVEMSPLDLQHKLFIVGMQRAYPGTTLDDAESAWSKNESATDTTLELMDAMWRKQKGITQ
jgi:hypothetical protein